LIFKISSTCFGQTFVHHQERKTAKLQHAWQSLSGILLHTNHIGPRCRPPDRQPTTATGHHTTCCNFAVLRSWWWTNICPKHDELILKINKYCYLLHLVGLDFITLIILGISIHCFHTAHVDLPHLLRFPITWSISHTFRLSPSLLCFIPLSFLLFWSSAFKRVTRQKTVFN
jgi:hypothetical protein